VGTTTGRLLAIARRSRVETDRERKIRWRCCVDTAKTHKQKCHALSLSLSSFSLYLCVSVGLDWEVKGWDGQRTEEETMVVCRRSPCCGTTLFSLLLSCLFTSLAPFIVVGFFYIINHNFGTNISSLNYYY
jgi:hypothetical protein